ncbi:GNG2 isoform 2 [Pongo abelii]|uniref:GNG2 isoform 2 n=1 Tax=Pongo abelii TaxID=9601 RepID=A0A2J8WKM5_PONAB|nr:GNG2 isoform 2 [Pongo abelii]
MQGISQPPMEREARDGVPSGEARSASEPQALGTEECF